MKTSELLKFTRTQTRDDTKPYRFPDEDYLDWLSEAQEKAARNARLLRDFTTPEICRLSLIATRQWLALDPRIIFVRQVFLASRTRRLDKISYRDLEKCQPGWIDRTGSPPTHWCTDFETGKLWFNRKVTTADTVKLFVVRMPLEALTLSKPNACPEIAPAYHRSLHHWASHRFYSVADQDSFDPDMAEMHLGKFHAEFGEDSTALEEEWAREQYGVADMDGEL